MGLLEDSSLWTELDLSASSDSLDTSSVDLGDVIKGILLTTTLGGGGFLLYASTAETARESGSGSGELAEVTGGFFLVGFGMVSFQSTSGGCTEPGIEIWQDSNGRWHVNDIVPYSRVEARASQIYSRLHNNSDERLSFPAIITENEKGARTIKEIFGETNTDTVLTKLSVFENLINTIPLDHDCNKLQ